MHASINLFAGTNHNSWVPIAPICSFTVFYCPLVLILIRYKTRESNKHPGYILAHLPVTIFLPFNFPTSGIKQTTRPQELVSVKRRVKNYLTRCGGLLNPFYEYCSAAFTEICTIKGIGLD